MNSQQLLRRPIQDQVSQHLSMEVEGAQNPPLLAEESLIAEGFGI